MPPSELESIAKLQAQFEYLNKGLDEFKKETKENNLALSEKIDELTKKFQEFAGYFNALAAQQITINELSTWRQSVAPTIDSIKNSKRKMFDIFWYVVQGVTAAAVLYLLKIDK